MTATLAQYLTLWIALLGAAGCVETLPLGGACSDASTTCAVVKDELVQNGSFELTRGSGGPLGFEANDTEGIVINLAAPWSACLPGRFSAQQSATSERGNPASELVRARDGAYFIEYAATFDELSGLLQPLQELSGLRQPLLVPLRRGQRYGFMIDVRASAGDEARLELWNPSFACLPGEKLADTGPVGDQWQSVCLVFEAPSEVGVLLLRPQARADAHVFFDHLRSEPACL